MQRWDFQRKADVFSSLMNPVISFSKTNAAQKINPFVKVEKCAFWILKVEQKFFLQRKNFCSTLRIPSRRIGLLNKL